MKKSILTCVIAATVAPLTCPAIEIGGAAATDISNWTTNNVVYEQGTTDGYTLNWENVITNTAAANIPNNNFDVSFETNTNYVIGHIYLFNEMLDLSTLPATGIEKLSWEADFDATAMQNWIPVIAVTDAGTTTFYRSNNTGNDWSGNSQVGFTFDNASSSDWIDLLGGPIGGIDASRGTNNLDVTSTTGMMQFGFIQWGASSRGSVSPQLDFTTAIEQFDVSVNEDLPPQEITETKNSSEFPNKYAGNEIYDGISFINDWNFPGNAEIIPSLDGTETILNVDNNGANGWIQQDNGTSPWETGVAAGGSWTVEVRVKMASDAGNTFAIWGENGSELGILQVTTNSVAMLDDDEILDTSDNTDDFHTFRMAYDADYNRYFVWRDGVLLTPSLGRPRNRNTTDNRLIVGDCCSSFVMTTIDIDYVRYDTTGSFAPAPEVPLEITNFGYDLATNMVSLTWRSIPGALYFVDGSIDMTSWPIEVGDVEGEAESEETTVMFEAEFETPVEEHPTEIFYRVRAG